MGAVDDDELGVDDDDEDDDDDSDDGSFFFDELDRDDDLGLILCIVDDGCVDSSESDMTYYMVGTTNTRMQVRLITYESMLM